MRNTCDNYIAKAVTNCNLCEMGNRCKTGTGTPAVMWTKEREIIGEIREDVPEEEAKSEDQPLRREAFSG